jgi:hypothetical protein
MRAARGVCAESPRMTEEEPGMTERVSLLSTKEK